MSEASGDVELRGTSLGAACVAGHDMWQWTTWMAAVSFCCSCEASAAVSFVLANALNAVILRHSFKSCWREALGMLTL